MKVLGLGHSHVVAIAKGCYELQHEGATIRGRPLACRFLYLFDPEIMPTLHIEEARTRLNPRLTDIIAEERPAFVTLSVGGNEHIAMSVVQRCGRIDFVLGEAPDLPLTPGATLLPEAAIRETLRDRMESTLSIILALKEATDAPLICIEPPPPLPDSQILAYPKEFFRRSVDPEKLSPELFRYKMWRVQSGLYRDICARHDIGFVAVPAALIAPPGVLAREAWGADATHANVTFGKVMVEQAIRLFERR